MAAESNVSHQPFGGQALAAIGILFGLALAAPLIGIVMVPFAAARTLSRARS